LYCSSMHHLLAVVCTRGRARLELLDMTESWSSVDAVAKHLGVAHDSIYRWIEARRLPAHKIGRLWKFKLSEVDEWVRAGGVAGHETVATKTKAKTKRGRS
jgi:excisionase family DNA binding protein